jgi:hypothetical protein
MNKIIVLIDKYNNIFGVDNDLCIGSVTKDNKLQKCSICIDGSTIPNVHYHKVKLFPVEQIPYYKNIFKKNFKNRSVIEIYLDGTYLEYNKKIVNNQIIVDIEKLYDTEIEYNMVLI